MIQGIGMIVLVAVVTAANISGDVNADAAQSDARVPSEKVNVVMPPVVNEKYEYYEVCGCCEKDLHCDLKDKCIKWSDGNKYDSVTNWKVTWDYGVKRSPRQCTVDSFTVTVDVVFHLPKWARPGDAPPSLVEKWDNYTEKLIVHEKGHRDRAVDAATELTRAIAELPPASTCSDIDRAVHKLCHARMDRLLEDQETYDEVTKHGYTQGAAFP